QCALVAAVVSRQVIALAGRRGLKPGPVAEQKIRPTHETVRVGVAYDRPHDRPRLPVPLDQGLCPARRGERVIFREDHYRGAGLANAGGVGPGNRADLANFDDAELTKVMQEGVTDRELLCRRRDDDEFEAAFHRLRAQMLHGPANGLVAVRRDNYYRHLRRTIPHLHPSLAAGRGFSRRTGDASGWHESRSMRLKMCLNGRRVKCLAASRGMKYRAWLC